MTQPKGDIVANGDRIRGAIEGRTPMGDGDRFSPRLHGKQQTRLLMGDELLRVWRETGSTVLLITHALDEAALLSDRVGVMSARPGRFIDVVSTGWARDRDSRIASDPGFGAITARLWAALRPESIKAMGRPAL
jgi:NitT/TauT family transport system ATP-binding protein